MDTCPIPAQSLEKYYPIDGEQLERHYREHLSDYGRWESKEHAESWFVFPENTGANLSMDGTSVSNGELYTTVTGKAAHGRKGALVATVEGAPSEKVTEALKRIPEEKQNQVEEITLDMSESMRKIVRRCFPNALRVTDRFHVQQPAHDTLQQIRIEHLQGRHQFRNRTNRGG